MIREPEAEIVAAECFGDYRLFTIGSPEIAREAQPGQFLMIKVSPDPYPLLRRPIGIHAREGDRVKIFFQTVGRGTEILAAKRAGEKLDIIGPLGRGFTLDGGLEGKRVLCVGGGRGIAPIHFLAQELSARGVRPIVLYGGRTASDIPLRRNIEEAGIALRVSTDDGSYGTAGFVTVLAAEELGKTAFAFLYACGPDAMMKATAHLAEKHRVPAELSLESHMGCGIGACWGCVKRIRHEGKESWIKICEDGPVFRREDIIWAENE